MQSLSLHHWICFQLCGVQNVNMQLYLFAHVFNSIEIGKKIRVHGHDFLSPVLWIGWIQWEMSLIWSDNWKCWQSSNIHPDGIIFSKETGDKHLTTNCLYAKTSISYLFTHWFHFIEIGKKIRVHGTKFWRCHQCLSQLDESDRCHWFDQTTGSVDSDQTFA